MRRGLVDREENFTDHPPDGEPAADRRVGALHLFDAPAPEVADAEAEAAPAEAWERARVLFDTKDFAAAARLLTVVVDAAPEQVAPRLLLARSYYHSAQLTRAEEQLRVVIDRCPVEHYAYLMLGRTLERQGRRGEAARWLRAAGAFTGDDEA